MTHGNATTGARIYLDFSVNDSPMGSDLALADPKAERLIRVYAAGERQIESVEIIKDGSLLYTEAVYGDIAEVEICDDEYCRGTDFYYARVRQVDGNTAWSSPIWAKLPVENIETFPYQVVRA